MSVLNCSFLVVSGTREKNRNRISSRSFCSVAKPAPTETFSNERVWSLDEEDRQECLSHFDSGRQECLSYSLA